MKNSLGDPENPSSAQKIMVKIFTHLTLPPSEHLLHKYARLLMSGFNQAPWDIYEYQYTVEKAKIEFKNLVFTALDSGGALLSLTCKGRPAGFSVVCNLGLFIRSLEEAEAYQRISPKYKNPGRYLELLSQLTKIPVGEFNTIGYVADVVVDANFRGKGLGKILLSSSVKFLKEDGKKFALAWTVNPVMAHALSQLDFKRIYGIGNQGEGIDFSVHDGAWYPTLVLPAKCKTVQAGTAIVAQHYLKTLLNAGFFRIFAF